MLPSFSPLADVQEVCTATHAAVLSTVAPLSLSSEAIPRRHHRYFALSIVAVFFGLGVGAFALQRSVNIPPVVDYSLVVRDEQTKSGGTTVLPWDSNEPLHAAPGAPGELNAETSSASVEVSSEESSADIVSSTASSASADFSSDALPRTDDFLTVTAPLSPPPIPSQIGVYLTEGSMKNVNFLTATLDHMKEMPGAALVFDVKGGLVYFASDAQLAKKYGLIHPMYELPAVLKLAHDRGIYTIGRFIAAKDPNLAEAVPEAQIRHPISNRSVGTLWVDPGNPTVLAYNEQLIRELARAGIDEINLDYIRYPTEYAQASIGLHGSDKSDHLYKFISMARRVIDEEGGRTKLGISSYAILGWNYPVNLEAIGQDVVRFAPLLDVISPMAYPATFAEGAYYNPARNPGSRMYYLVQHTLEGYAGLLGEHAWKLRPWIQGYGITTKNLKDQIQGVFDSGACGFQIWNAWNEYDVFYGIMKDVKRPAGCGI